jgi:hypothetical protein
MVQRPSEDQAGPGQGPHTCVISTQVRDVAVVQGGQSSMQVRLLACSRALRQWHLDLLAFLYLRARGPERGIMEHARGWCNKLETNVQMLELFQGGDPVLLTET